MSEDQVLNEVIDDLYFHFLWWPNQIFLQTRVSESLVIRKLIIPEDMEVILSYSYLFFFMITNYRCNSITSSNVWVVWCLHIESFIGSHKHLCTHAHIYTNIFSFLWLWKLLFSFGLLVSCYITYQLYIICFQEFWYDEFYKNNYSWNYWLNDYMLISFCTISDSNCFGVDK